MDEIKEERVIIDGENKIGATISYIDDNKKKPLVLLIMGTGKLNRDGNQFGMKTDFYKTLSDMFVNWGYVCVRYDKRGTHESTGNFNKTGLSDLVNDAKSVIDYAKDLPYVDETKIIACGHSEGAMISTLLTKQTELDSIILLGGAGMCLRTAMEFQNFQVLDELKDKKGFIGWYLNKVINKEKVMKQLDDFYKRAAKAKKDTFFYNGAMMPAKWLKEHGELSDEDFIKMIEEYNGHVLAITGKGDVQADARCLERLKEFSNVVTYAPEKVNHMLREVDDASIMKVKKQYKKIAKEPMHEGTKEVIKSFLKKR